MKKFSKHDIEGKISNAAYADQKHGIYCLVHKDPNMIDVRSISNTASARGRCRHKLKLNIALIYSIGHVLFGRKIGTIKYFNCTKFEPFYL